MDKLRIGLVGCGHMGRFHAARLSELKEIEFAGCADIDFEKASVLASQYKVKAFKDAEAMIGSVDAVSIAVPTIAHPDMASLFLNANVAVLLEKPIAGDIESAEKLVALAESKRAVFQIGHSERFNPAFLAVEKGICDPKFIEIHRLAPFKGRGIDVPVIFDLMVHDLDLIMALTGSPPVKVEASGAAVITDTIDIVNARLVFPSGCVANVTASRISIKEMRKLRVFQKSGYTSIDMASREAEQYVVTSKDGEEYHKASIFGRLTLPNGEAVVRRKVAIPAGDNLRHEITSFAEAVRGEHPPVVSGQDGLNVLRVAAKIEQCCNEYSKSI